MKRILLPQIDPEQATREIGDFAVQQCVEYGKTGLVLGLSGGVDSTVTAAIVSKRFAEEDGLSVKGYILPSDLNPPEDESDALQVARRLGMEVDTISIDPIVQGFREATPWVFESDYDSGNLRSEIRADILSRAGAAKNKFVALTGNRDEDDNLGYYTFGGDGRGHLSLIVGLSKRHVKELARYHGFEEIADREPTAGLEPGQTDFGDIGYSYDFAELVGEGLNLGFSYEQLREHPQIVEMAKTEMGMYQTRFGSLKHETIDDMLGDFKNRNFGAKLKEEFPIRTPVTVRYE